MLLQDTRCPDIDATLYDCNDYYETDPLTGLACDPHKTFSSDPRCSIDVIKLQLWRPCPVQANIGCANLMVMETATARVASCSPVQMYHQGLRTIAMRSSPDL